MERPRAIAGPRGYALTSAFSRGERGHAEGEGTMERPWAIAGPRGYALTLALSQRERGLDLRPFETLLAV